MGYTMTQKILAARAGVGDLKPGQLLEIPVDLVPGNDVTAPVAIREMEAAALYRVFDSRKIALVLDHFAPNKGMAAARRCSEVRAFAKKHRIMHFYDVGAMGTEHVLLPELGLIAPGEIVIGSDSHTCTYGALGAFAVGVGSTDMAAGMARGRIWFKTPEALRVVLTGTPGPYIGGKDVALYLLAGLGVDGASYRSLEFAGPGVAALSMADRFTICNMAVECGAKNAIFPADGKTEAYLSERSSRPWTAYLPDDDAAYAKELSVDLSALVPLVACPHHPSDVKPAEALSDVRVHQVVIGSCTNGRLEDMRIAASILKNRKVAEGVRCVVVPGSREVYLKAMDKGFLADFIRAGAVVSTPTRDPCLGGHMGLPGEGGRCVATANRSFAARTGQIKSEIYLAGPAVAAASAVAGYIAVPDSL